MNAPVDVRALRDLAVDALLGGSGGYLMIPKGSRVGAAWMERAGVYRLTIDVRVDGPYDRAFAEGFNAETLDRVERLRAGGVYA